MEQNQLSPQDYLAILRRRRWQIVVPALVVFGVACLVAVFLPPIYRSTATILIEEQDIPDDFVKSAVSTFADQQLQVINQRVMSTTKLQEIIQRNNLYAGQRGSLTDEQLVDKLRKSIRMEPKSVDVVDPRTGRPMTVTIAFTLSYESSGDPAKVQQIANVLTSLFLEENVKTREQQASGISDFMQDEMVKVKAEIEAVDAKLASFKARNVNALPELMQVNMQTISNLEGTLDRLNEQKAQLKQRESELSIELASISPNLEQGSRMHLDELKAKLISLEKSYTPEHPDVVKTRAEIRELESQIKADSRRGRAENPAYVTVASQLASVRSEQRSISAQISEASRRLNEYRSRVETTPMIEGDYTQLTAERASLQAKYDEMNRKYMDARVFQGLEKEQKGERFTLLDPAKLPEKPYKPNRLAIVLIGLVLAVGAGVGVGAVMEFNDDSIHKTDDIRRLTGLDVLGSVPYITTDADLLKLQQQRKYVWGAAGAFVLLVLVIVQIKLMPLGVILAKLAMKFGF
ncbi:MAG: Chromosome partition protein Smc [Deltaproteobacteria bacterium ADurb.Bin510]|nr:MAG: Chromosome partition protein Smc [Deltaproteobacteria bacterium ADurb.Bin510]